MAIRHRLIEASPQQVWDVLAASDRYGEWVVGTAKSRPCRGNWPEVDAALTYEFRLGPATLTNETVVRRCEEGSALELEAIAGPLGTARIAIELRPWGEHCLVIVDEHPLRGTGGRLHNVAVEGLIQLRHRTMLARLAEICETYANGDGDRRERATAGPRRGADRA
ncbi:SRPBCC family protein [Streptomyces sp. B93]|uniref:SRPBCC family protein n=1 Tax=Streptomyces sp. B93 TaxID=2824875 RepID=UPI001B36EAF5|nr:SRPBCC family protein [Streptomyces sp. B93]MBQ1093906.1 SRPBCC family protein [Streptomyces sp. B93]